MWQIAAVVVTYNRCEMLVSCLKALLNQSFQLDKIIVVDNASTDETPSFFSNKTLDSDRLRYVRLDENKGGAGGFKEGMRIAVESGCDACWIMDDDVLPAPDALEALVVANDFLSSQGIKPGFLASHVRGPLGETMNVPTVSSHVGENGYPDWSEFLPEGLVRVSFATFVSLLIPTDAIQEVGLPIGDYFLWGDDTEYTKRLTAYYGPAYVCGRSTVLHMRKAARAISAVEEPDSQRIKNHRRATRNELINASYYDGVAFAARRMAHWLKECSHIVVGAKDLKMMRLTAVGGGVLDFLLRKYDLEDLAKLDKHNMRFY